MYIHIYIRTAQVYVGCQKVFSFIPLGIACILTPYTPVMGKVCVGCHKIFCILRLSNVYSNTLLTFPAGRSAWTLRFSRSNFVL